MNMGIVAADIALDRAVLAGTSLFFDVELWPLSIASPLRGEADA